MSDQALKTSIITSFDLLRNLATICLVISHYGFFFDNNTEFFQMLAHFGYLLFIFCFGYNRQFNFNPILCFLTALMVINSLVIEPDTLTLTNILDNHILFSVIIAQVFMYFIAGKLKDENIFSWMIMLELLALPTGKLFQFGSEGIVICICGYLCATKISRKLYNIFLTMSLTFYAIIESMKFQLSPLWIIFLILVFIALWRVILKFKTKYIRIHVIIDQVVLFMSKYSLLIFFVHYEVFKFIHWYINIISN